MTLKYLYSLLLCILVSSGAAQAVAQSPGEIVKTTADQVIARLQADREGLKARPEMIYGLVDDLIVPKFDFRSMSMMVLGKNWRTATAAQQAAFTAQFQTLLVRTYTKALLEYSDDKIVYHPEQKDQDSKLVLVKTDIARTGSSKIPINYNLYSKDGEWKVVDVIIDGISLVSTYRGSFAAEIRTKGLDSLIQQLVDKNNLTAINNTQPSSGTR
ncbi:MAG: hypothetical protein A3G96_00135 [Gammaproteobacteria bacterium RIFCSPLOWO2_12_FULL_52_10]|nr:MAG: hypothetical protein A3G96_00135 [Gammaproteobacteria bacterium RIFCSPLOWO2_12_FULL_52_10]